MLSWIVAVALSLCGMGFFALLGGFGGAADALERWGATARRNAYPDLRPAADGARGIVRAPVLPNRAPGPDVRAEPRRTAPP